ncbi:unnamed protein product, partial [Protopolystoma xenopodis]
MVTHDRPTRQFPTETGRSDSTLERRQTGRRVRRTHLRAERASVKSRHGYKRKAGVGGEAAVSSKRRLAVPLEACRTDSESERSARSTRLDAYASAGLEPEAWLLGRLQLLPPQAEPLEG